MADEIRQKGLLKKLQALQVKYFGVISTWIETNDDDFSVSVTAFLAGVPTSFDFYVFNDDDEINSRFQYLKEKLKIEAKNKK